MRSQARDCSVPLKLSCIPAVIAGLRAASGVTQVERAKG